MSLGFDTRRTPDHHAIMRPPNIILINCDDLGFGDIGCYGSTLHATPRLDELARRGCRFTDFYQAAPVCTPSRAAMLTGCYAQRIGLEQNQVGSWVLFPGDSVGLNPDEITIASLLKKTGYATALIGKWHVGDQPAFFPSVHGFDEYYGLPFSNDMGTRCNKKYRFPPLPLIHGDKVIEQEPDQAHLTARYTDQAVKFIHENQRRPFFLYFAHMYTHLPLYPDPRFVNDSQNGDYGAEVACIDWSAGVLLDTLRELGIEQDTLVMFTSDNGAHRTAGGSNLPLRGHKGTCFEGGQRLPLIASWPGVIDGGRTCSTMLTAMDLMPTLATFAGGKMPTDRIIDGRDASDIMLGKTVTRDPDDAFFYYLKRDLHAVRQGRWKWFAPEGQLYDLHNDLGETTDESGRHADVVDRMRRLVETCRDDLGDDLAGASGRRVRPPGRVSHPKTLTDLPPDDPNLIAAYD